jgi:hypothetical protein
MRPRPHNPLKFYQLKNPDEIGFFNRLNKQIIIYSAACQTTEIVWHPCGDFGSVFRAFILKN